MSIKVAINGYGRIGRNILRALYESNRTHEIQVVAINDLGDAETNAHLTQYDTAHGKFPGTVSVDGGDLIVNGDRIKVCAERDPSKLPWGALGVDVVLECTGLFTSKAKASAHLAAGAKKVIISAPGEKDVDNTVVFGVNEGVLRASDTVISNASCTTNCLAPLAKVLNDTFGIERGLMTTVHAYTADQNLQDGPHKDLRRARAAAVNIVPASTGAAKAIGLVLPELNGKLSGSSYRVPVPTGSIVDLTIVTPTAGLTVDAINAAYRAAASEGRLAGYLQYTEDPLVSSDIQLNPHSSIFDSELTNVSGTLAKVSAWYDNEWGYSNRLVDLTEYVAARL